MTRRSIARIIGIQILVVLGLIVGTIVVSPRASANTGKVSLTPDPVTLVEGDTQIISIRLDEPIIAPGPDPATLTVNLVSSDPTKISLSTDTVTYTASEWAQAKTFTISAVQNSDVTGNASVSVSFSVDSNSVYYDNYTNQIAVTYVDAELQDNFAGGIGTVNNPYQISTCQQLQNINNHSLLTSANYELVNEIDCSDTINWNGGLGWDSLASFSDRFTGSLDGNGYSINGLYQNREPDPAGLGLFSYVEDATFTNFSINGSVSNPNTNMGTCIGSLVGAVFGSVIIQDVQSTVNVSGEQDTIGGVVGCLLNGDDVSSIAGSSVNAVLSGGVVGGLIGDVDMSNAATLTIENSTTSGQFSGSDVGGLIRQFMYREWDTVTNGSSLVINDVNSSAEITADGGAGGLARDLVLAHRGATITNSSFTGNLTTTVSSGAGGLFVGVQSFSDDPSETVISQSYVSSLITSTSNDVGGLVGVGYEDHTLTIEESYFGGVIDTSGDRVGGLVADARGNTTISNSYADAELNGDQYIGGLVGTGQVDIEKSFAFGTIISSGTVLGGLAGSLSDSTVLDSFAAVSVPPNQPTTIGGLIGAISNVMMDNLYVDAGRTQQACYFTGTPEDTSVVDCNPVNEDGSDRDYFFNNSINPPIDQWDFDTVWQTNEFFYPCLQWQDSCQTFQPQVVCEQPTATATTVTGRCDIQVRSGYNYGTTTWEARYQKVGDGSYTPLTLADNTAASATVTGLGPNTEYYLEFRFTNNWGTGEWARLEFITEVGPDINIAMSSAEDQSPIDFSVSGCGSLGDWQTLKESDLAVKDSAYSYPVGIVAFKLLNCPVGGSASISLTFTTELDPTNLVTRKLNENTRAVTTLTPANSNIRTIRTVLEGKNAVRVDYTITDGGLFDQDGITNGEIQDPVGIAKSIIGAPNTGIGKL